MNDQFKGIILYNIELDGNLNGVYTNNHPNTRGEIYTETARLKKNFPQFNNNTEVREYDAFYFDLNNERVDCLLKFSIQNRIIDVIWELVDGRVLFRGQGFQMNDRQIAISYWLSN